MWGWRHAVKHFTQCCVYKVKKLWCSIRGHGGVTLDYRTKTVTCKRCKKIGMKVNDL